MELALAQISPSPEEAFAPEVGIVAMLAPWLPAPRAKYPLLWVTTR
jgi:hypothetical protein